MMIEACGTRYMAEQRAYMQLNNARVISKKKKNKLRTQDETKKMKMKSDKEVRHYDLASIITHLWRNKGWR